MFRPCHRHSEGCSRHGGGLSAAATSLTAATATRGHVLVGWRVLRANLDPVGLYTTESANSENIVWQVTLLRNHNQYNPSSGSLSVKVYTNVQKKLAHESLTQYIQHSVVTDQIWSVIFKSNF